MKAVFLDRDGVINELVYHQELGVIDSPFSVAEFKLCAGVPLGIARFHAMGYQVVIISNQPGIAKGHMSEADFEAIRSRMKGELGRARAFLDADYYCLHHPQATIQRLKADCQCRKPGPGLLLRAAWERHINLSRSWMIGDGLTDVRAGKLAGTRTILIGKMKCELCKTMDEEDSRPDAICADLPAAAAYIRMQEQAVAHSFSPAG